MSFLKHYQILVIHYTVLHFKNEETLFYSAGPISRYSRPMLFSSKISPTKYSKFMENFGKFSHSRMTILMTGDGS